MDSNGLLWAHLVFCLELEQSLFLKLRLLCTPMDSTELLEPIPASDLSLTPMNSYGLLWTPLIFCLELEQSLFLKLRLLWTPMDSTEILQPIAATDLSLSLLVLEL